MSIEEDYEANKAELGEALILITQVLDCRSIEDLNVLRRFLSVFVDRYSERPLLNPEPVKLGPECWFCDGTGRVTVFSHGEDWTERCVNCGGTGIGTQPAA